LHRVFHFQSRPDPYRCDASVVACYDHRFDMVLRKFLRRSGVLKPDMIIVAGGAKQLASPEHEVDRACILDQIGKSIKLHGTERVLLLLHSDCGAYGGLDKRFNGDIEAEARHHRDELRIAWRLLREALPKLTVECFFIDFDGVWQLDYSQLAGPAPSP
jgi:carbonic anhydrase